MIRVLGLVLMMLAWFPASGRAAETFDDVLTALEGPLSNDDPEAAYVLLSRALRDARVGGWLTKDWAIFFAMQADFARLDQANPSYALQLTQDGLALIGGDPAQADFAVALQISRAYALADLGRFQEAARAAKTVLPAFRAYWGDADADDLDSRIQRWSDGQLTDFNTAATDLARQSLDAAYDVAGKGEHGRAISLAAAAILPMGTDLAEADVRSVNTEAELLIAEALAALGRVTDSANALLRALGHMTRTPWQTGEPIDWWPQSWDDDTRRIMFRLLTDLSSRALALGYDDIGVQTLREAEAFAVSADNKATLLLLQAGLSYRTGDSEAALDLIARTRAQARAAGDIDLIVMTDFYEAVVRSRMQSAGGQLPDPDPVIVAAEAALARHAAGGGIDRRLILSDAAQVLSNTSAHERAFRYARAALAAQQDEILGRSDTDYASAQARLGARGPIETLLKTAHDAAGGLDPARGQNCPVSPGFMGCVIVAQRP